MQCTKSFQEQEAESRQWVGGYACAGDLGNQDTSVAYSIVVLCGEAALGLLGFYGHQLFWKQTLNYTHMSADTLQRSAQASPLKLSWRSRA